MLIIFLGPKLCRFTVDQDTYLSRCLTKDCLSRKKNKAKEPMIAWNWTTWRYSVNVLHTLRIAPPPLTFWILVSYSNDY